MALPDFLIIGAMKCGTTTLAAQLAAQAGLFITTPKEPNFFSDDANFAKGLPWYESLFDAAAPGDLRGEASTHYTKLPHHPHTLARLVPVLPKARLICMIRNPLDRAVSHYIHAWSDGTMSGDIEAAFESHPELIDYGRYGHQLAPWVAAYGRDRLFVSSLEAMTAAPQALLDRIGGFLGRDGLVWQADKAQENVSAQRVRPLPLQDLLVYSPLATALRRRLVPRALRDRIRKGRQMQTRPTLTPALRARLEAIFAEDHARLVALLPDCPDIAASYPFVAATP